MSAAVILSEAAADALLAIPTRSGAKAVAQRLQALQTFPEMGARYDPEYPATRPDHEVLVTYASNYGIYYIFDHELRGGTVYIEWIQDERRNPMGRFEG